MYQSKNTLVITFVGGLVLMSSLAFANAKHSRVGPNTQISFDAGSAELSAAAKTKLDHVVKMARDEGRIAEVQVAVWSDNPTPRPDTELSAVDRDLADQRAARIKDYLQQPLGVSDKVVYNMAERTGWMAKTFKTDESKMRTEVAKGSKTPVTPGTKEQFRIFKEQGDASKAVVIVMLKP